MEIQLSDKQFELIQTIKTYEDVPHRLSDAKFNKLYDEINEFYKSHPDIYSSLLNSFKIINNTLESIESESSKIEPKSTKIDSGYTFNTIKNYFVYGFDIIKNYYNNQSYNVQSEIENKPQNVSHIVSPQKFISINSLSNSQKDIIHLIKRYRELPHRLINKRLLYDSLTGMKINPYYLARIKINNLRNNVFNLFNREEYPNLRKYLLTFILCIKIDISLLNLSDKNNANQNECIIAINYLVFLLKSLKNHNDPLLIYLTQQLNSTKPSAFKLLQKRYPKFEQQIFLPLLVLHKYNSLFRPFLLNKIEEELYKNNYFNNSDSEITFHQLEKWGNEIILNSKLQLQ